VGGFLLRWRSVKLDGRLKNILMSPGLAVVAAFVLRMFFFWLMHRGGDIDNPRFRTVGIEIESVARSIAGGFGFSKIMYIFEGPTAWIAPVFPYLIAPVSKLTHLNTAATLAGCQILNSVFAAMTCWPIYALGKRIFGPGVGLASAWLWVFLPTAVQMPLEWVWDQSLSALLLPLLLCATFAIRESESKIRWTGYGLFWAFAALTNPALCVLLPFLLVWVMWVRRKSFMPTVLLTARAALFFALGLLPWTVRNYWAMDGFVPVKSNFGLELWLGNNPAVQHIYTPRLHPWVDSNQAVALAMNGEVNYSHKAGRSALLFIETHPSRFLELLLERIGDTWTDKYDVQTDPWLMELHLEKAYVIYYSGFSLLGLAGLLVGSYQYRVEVVPLALAVLLFPVIYYVTHSAARYRHPIDPVMCILSVFVVEQALWLVSLKLKGHEEKVTASLEAQAAVSSRN
jgi:4-amino-4-deoxy-L-arabinose transferase-like glycosyltransferase